MNELTIDERLLSEALHPYAAEKERELQRLQRRFVHYTSADVAFSILKKREIWMRNAQTMNDFSEIQHGMSCLLEAKRAGLTEKFGAALDAIHPGTWTEVTRRYDGWNASLRFDTFMACVSEHLGPENDEDKLGRLSMWRAYGGQNGVALILNPRFMDNPDMDNLFTSPVFYGDAEAFCVEFTRVIDGLATVTDVLARVDPSVLAARAFNALRFGALCTKHPGFREEREWRVLYTPQLGLSPFVKEAVEVIGGVPQTIHKIQLVNNGERGVTGLDPAQLIEGLIVGPTQYRMTLAETFHKALVKAGVPDVTRKLRFSEIPLRK